MKISKRRIATLISLLFLLTTGASAQNFGSVTLKLEDAKTGEPVGFATVSLTPKGCESAKQYILSDSEGVARMTKIKKGTYTIKAELLGYKPYEKEISIEKRVDLGVIKMKEDPELLDAASASAVGNPIIMKKDPMSNIESFFVPRTGVEPTRVLPHWLLKPARLPISPSGRGKLISVQM